MKKKKPTKTPPLGDLEGLRRVHFPDGRAREIRFRRQELTAQEKRDLIESAKGLKGLGIRPAHLLDTEFVAELAVAELRREREVTDASLIRSLERGSSDVDAIDAPSVRARLKSGRWSWRLARIRYWKAYLDECADALRLKDSRRRPPRSPDEMEVTWGYWQTYQNLQKEFASRARTRPPRPIAKRPPFTIAVGYLSSLEELFGKRPFDQSISALKQLAAGHLPLEGQDLEPAISRQVAAFLKSKNDRGHLTPSQRVKLALLELMRQSPVADIDLDEAERLTGVMQKAVRDATKRSLSAKLSKK